MRLYIANRTNGPHCPLYYFHEAIESGMHWKNKEWVELVCLLMAAEGITVRQPATGNVEPCTAFLVEQRPQGGFVISCEVPL